MTELHLQQCRSLSTNDSPFTDEQSSDLLPQLNPQWQFDNNEQIISHTFKFTNYYQTIAFVNVIAQIAHQQNHHPDLLVSYNRCKVTYSTHSVGGLSINDFICAARINNAQSI